MKTLCSKSWVICVLITNSCFWSCAEVGSHSCNFHCNHHKPLLLQMTKPTGYFKGLVPVSLSLAMWHGLQDLSSQARDGNYAPCSGDTESSQWTTRALASVSFSLHFSLFHLLGTIHLRTSILKSCSGVSVGKESACNAGDTGDKGSTPGSGRYPRGGNGNPLQYSCLENPMDRGAWSATALGVAKIQTWLKRLSTHTHTHTHTHTLKSNHIYGKFRKSPHTHKKRSRLI